MRLDNAGPKTWLLAAAAGWALGVWLLALFGLGGRIERLPDDPALRQPLPQLAPPAEVRPGPLPLYSETAARPLFTENRRPQPFFIDGAGEAAPANAFDYVLTSVLLAPDFRMAILQPTQGGDPQRLKIGDAPDTAPGWVLAAVEPRAALFNGPEGERKLELRVFDGVGGEPPTALTVTPPQPPGQPVQPAVVGPPPPQQRPAPANPNAARTAPPNPGPPAAPPSPQPQPGQAPQGDAAAAQTSAEQIEAIRRRIEARRAQLRQQQQSQQPPPPPAQSP